MSQRRYGPVQGAGTSILESDAEKTIVPSALGVTVHVGVYERGTVGGLNYAPKQRQFTARLGGRLTNGYVAPDAALDFYDTSEGAGELWCVRVTAGNEVKAFEYSYNRRIPRSAVIKWSAHDGGRWGGGRAFLVGQMKTTTLGTTTTTDLTETTMGTGKTMLKDYWKGATLKLKAVPTKSYEVLGNTTAGVVSVISDATMLTDYGVASDLEYTLELVSAGKQLAIYIHDSTERPTEEWGFEAYYCGVLEYSKDNLSSDPTSPRYFANAINDDTSNFTLAVVDLWTGGYSADIRPANHYEQLVNLSETAAQIEIMQSRVNSAGGGNAAVSGYSYGQLVKAQTLTLTFASATTYNVVSDKYGVLNDTPVALGDEFVPDFGEDYVPSFIVSAGSIPMTATDTITVVVAPLVPDELTNGVIYPDKAGHRRIYYSIIANTVDTVTVKPDSDMMENADAGTKATVTGSTTGPTFDTSTNRVFKLTLNGGEEVTVNLTQGATTPGTTIVADINTALGVAVASMTTDNHVKLTSTIGGRLSKLALGTGSANTPLGFTPSASYIGAAGDSAMLQWPQQLSGGYDGLAELDDSDYEAMFDVDSSPIKRMWGQHKGLVKMGNPGVTSTSVQKKGALFGEAVNYQYRYQIPANIVTEDAAEEYVNDTLGRSDFAVVAFPSFAYIKNPIANSEGLKLVSTMGSIHGREAKMAKNWGGYHKAAAGIDVTLPGFVKLPTGDAILDEETLNPQGIQILKFYNGNLIVWGDRTVSLDPAWRWKHQREQMSHYENTLRENFDWIIFAINDTETWSMAWVELDDYFSKEKTNRALEDYHVKIDAENNTAATKAEGDVYVDIRLKFTDTVERFKIRMQKVGIFEDTGV